MAQTWQLGVEPVRPGTYFRREREGVSVAGATNGVLAVLFQSNWGQLNVVTEATQADLNNLEDIFGTGAGVDKLQARFEGNRNFTVTIRDNLMTDKRQVLIHDGAQVFTSVSFDAGGD